MARIFVSYRREGSAGFAGRIKDELERRFGEEDVFRDVDDIVSGEDFVERLNRALRECRVLIAVIGPNWLTARNAQGQSRLHETDDFVRREIGAALASDVRVIPVLVNGARIPSEADLPDDLKSLARRQAYELADSRWDYDVDQLGDRIEESLGSAAGPTSSSRRRWFIVTASVAVFVIAGYVGWRHLASPPHLAGIWDMPNGSYWIIEQSDASLKIQEVHYDSREVWKKGVGVIQGDTIEYKLDFVFQRDFYTHGELRLSGDGARLAGVAFSQPRNTKADLNLMRR